MLNLLSTSTATPRAGQLLTPARPQPELDIRALERYVHVSERKVRAGESVYQGGQPFHSLHLVRVGFIKTCELSEDGREQITGFWMRGDLLGVEAIGLASYPCEAVALEDSVVWQLPYPPVLVACQQVPELQARLTAALAESIRRDRSWMLSIGTLTAEQRVANFLVDLAERHARLGFSARHFTLRMGRADIASFLALTHETVSRALAHLERLRYVEVDRRDVRLLDLVALCRLAGTQPALH